MAGSRPGVASEVPVLHVHTPDGRVLRFQQPFRLGRDPACDVHVDDVHVSRRHLAVHWENGAWQIRDLESANGLLVDGRRVPHATVNDRLTVKLGVDGPTLLLEVEGRVRARNSARASQPTVQSSGSDTRLLKSYEEKYFGSGPAEGGGGRTRIIRMAFARAQQKQRRRYLIIVGIAGIVALAAGIYAAIKHRQVSEQKEAAEAIFYEIKAQDVQIAQLERMIEESGSADARQQVRTLRARRREMQGRYDQLEAVRNLYDSKLSEEEKLILRVAREFGECELAAPEEYVALVKEYIERWKTTPRFVNAVRKANDMGVTKVVIDEFTAQGLPPQFFYLAMQESSFEPFASGPPTSWGIAKGMWQFIPDTGKRFGLRIGPLQKVRRPDPDDDRHDWRKATVAAARYIKEIYSTDAQASGLLVMASYNWGEGRVIRMVRSLNAHPQDRNFWKLIERYRIPGETYDYVFSIVSAAVIGENPRLFGFDVDNPLAE